ncbi:TetR/AcrR family transcriptional regulator [Micromonospora sp. NBC_00898]|uniref:TetR/AcrR family transcriptional regulator n=1 Tax=Micromonospora sp. NBC_00898 TaxID=2975981 RepID=UPI00386BCF01|nr:TetR/AcrR family transcriptional regulator [Micromonospora sp. NBC_00898]
MDEDLTRAAVAVLGEVGWDGLTLERVAEEAGRSRVTLWRNGITRESLLRGLLRRLAEDYRDAMLPVLTAAGTPRERLGRAMHALADVVDAHTDVLTVSDEMFHRAYEAGEVPMGFLDPFIAVIRDARAAGQLRGEAPDAEQADVLFNAVAWTYLHFRARHGWSATKARRLLFDTLIEGALR